MNDKTNRRDFIVKPLQWAAGARLLSELDSPLFAQSPAPPSGATPIRRRLGKTGITMPIVAMGVMNADVPGVVRRAYEVGIRHFDTAAGYQQGRNEEMVGNVIKELGVRDQVTIATKAHVRGTGQTPAQVRDSFIQTFEGSLKRLQMDHVDVLFYHSVDKVEDVGSEGVLEALAMMKKQGKTRATGISTHRGDIVIEEALRVGGYEVVLCTINYTMASNRALLDAIDHAAKSGVGIFAMKTQAGGTVKPDPKLPKNLPPASQTALLKWVLRNENITAAIPGFTTYDQLEQNFSVVGNLAYTDAEKQFLADKTFAAEAQFCRQCAQCRPDCPHQVDIPTLMRTHMYAVQYSNHGLAADTLASIGEGRGLDACANCESCSATCRGTVNIPRKIEQLKKLYSPRVLA
jgi:hypothetical protein